AKALELGNNPVNIQNWVRNNVEWVPTWGAIQSAQDTLDKKRGNAIDIASLEIALLRAAKIPARYQFGTIELPAEQVMNWVGGVSKPEAAQQLLGQGGIANRGLIEGGRISKIRMEHAWVQAYVNWLPSRGAKQGSATQHPSPQGQRNAWVPLDPSFKQYSYAPARDVSAGLPDTSNQLWTSLMSGSQLGDSGASIRNLNAYALAEKIEQYSRASAEQVRQLPAPPQAQDLVSRKILPVTVASILNGVLPYGVVGAASELSAVPAQLVHAMTLKLYGSTMDRVTESPIATYRLGLSSLSKRLGIRYYPASAQDEALLADYRQRPVAGIPAYLVRMVGRIELDGQAIAELPVSTMGAEQYWVAEMHDPSGVGSGEYDFKVVGAVGDEAVFGFNTSGVLEVNFPADKQGLTASETLHVLALNYWGQLDKTDATLALASDVVAVRLPSFGFFAQPLQVVYSWGVARSAYYAGRMMDVRRSYLSVVAKDGSLAKRDAFLDTEGAIASYYEGAVLDAMFGHGLGESVSAVSALMTANQAGQKIFSINAANHATIQPQLAGLSEDTRRTIADAVSMGSDVIVSESRVLKGSWRGSGIIIKDASGQGRAYLIDGGANGGQESECDKDRRNNPKGVDVHSLLRGLASLFLVLLAILIAAAAIACILGTGGLCGGGLAPVAAAVGALFLAGTAAAQSLNFVPVMPLDGYGQVAWSVSHGKMIPWPVSAPDSVPRTCDPAVETALAIAKAAACNVPRSCDKGQSCPDYKVRIDNGLRCISARLEVMQACYPVGPGAFGDEPHWNELRRVVDTLGKCMCYSGEGACQITVGD
ncbi:MAG: transglutaminase domain-containing protein, partial [Burkholderiaceae bacterium]